MTSGGLVGRNEISAVPACSLARRSRSSGWTDATTVAAWSAPQATSAPALRYASSAYNARSPAPGSTAIS
jgi:hypothetical protein